MHNCAPKTKAMFGPKKIPLPGNEDFHMKVENPPKPGSPEIPATMKAKRAGARIFAKKAGK